MAFVPEGDGVPLVPGRERNWGCLTWLPPSAPDLAGALFLRWPCCGRFVGFELVLQVQDSLVLAEYFGFCVVKLLLKIFKSCSILHLNDDIVFNWLFLAVSIHLPASSLRHWLPWFPLLTQLHTSHFADEKYVLLLL